MVRNNSAISGYRLGGVETNIEQYADDCTFILDGSESSFAACMETVSIFSMVSGLELNAQKHNFSGWANPEFRISLPIRGLML